MKDLTELDLLAPLGKVDAPSDETMREVAALLAAESGLKPVSPRRFGKRNLAIGVGAVAAAAAVFAAVSLAGAITQAPQRNAASGDPDLRDLVLSALATNADSILHVTTTAVNDNDLPDPPVAHLWYSSAQPKAGQPLTVRNVFGLGSSEQDSAETYVVTSTGAMPPNCEVVQVRYQLREWTKRTGECPYLGEPQLDLTQEIAKGEWHRAPGQTTVDGQPAIRYTQEVDGDNSKGIGNSTQTLWINANTNLPISDQTRGFAANGTLEGTVTIDFSFLPDTEQNRAQLTVPIPAGFTQVPEFPRTRH